MGTNAAFFKISSNGNIAFIRRIVSGADTLYCKGITLDPAHTD